MRGILPLLLLICPALNAGTLEGTVLIQGKIPTLAVKKVFNPYANDYDEPEAEPTPPPEPDHHLLVYLEGVPGNYKAPSKDPVLGQKYKHFEEDIVPVIAGGELEITNNDTVYHHIRSSTKPWVFNLNKKAPGETVTVNFDAKKGSDTRVVPIYCDIHSSMRAHVVVLDNPFYALLKETGGKFKISGIPAGTYTLDAFHPTLKFDPIKVIIPASGKAKPVKLILLGEQ
jgi:plastocyanin